MSISQPSRSDSRALFWGAVALAFCFAGWACGLFAVGRDVTQGDVYRILYLHVPSAFAAFLSTFLLFVFSVVSLLRKQSNESLWLARASAEIALIFTCITLISGSIWGRPTWGTWWTWDGRLTTTFILAILLGGYLLLWNAFEHATLRRRACGVVGILIFIDVPIIYKSVTWWRTLHQPPSLLSSRGQMMSSEILVLLLFCVAGVLSLSLWLIWQRSINLGLQARIESISFAQWKG